MCGHCAHVTVTKLHYLVQFVFFVKLVTLVCQTVACLTVTAVTQIGTVLHQAGTRVILIQGVLKSLVHCPKFLRIV